MGTPPGRTAPPSRGRPTRRPGCGPAASWQRLTSGRKITAAKAAQQERTGVTADRALEELARVAFADVADLHEPDGDGLRHPRAIPFETRRAVAGVWVRRVRTTVTKDGKRTTTVRETVVRYKLADKVAALELLAGYLGLDAPVVPLAELLAALPPDLAAAVRAALR